ncbi:MAG: hypothetical protein ACTSV5_05705 [Promethearchaeota archaeon]
MKDKVVTVRVEDILWEEIKKYSQDHDMSKSKITRNALIKYFSIYRNPLPLILWSRNEFAFALNCLNDKQIKSLAEISFQNGLKAMDILVHDLFNIEDITKLKLSARNAISLLVNYTFTEKGQNWFSKVKTIWHKNAVIIYGNHENGINFSKYVKHIIIPYTKLFSWDLIEEELNENKIYLEFKLIKK